MKRRGRAAQLATTSLIGGFVLVVAGIAAPRLASDCECGLTAEQQHRLEVQARARMDIPPLGLRVKQASAFSDDPDSASGTVGLLGPFGVETGEVLLSPNGHDLRERHWLLALLWFCELGALALCVGGAVALVAIA